jgi:hypothetical protein
MAISASARTLSRSPAGSRKSACGLLPDPRDISACGPCPQARNSDPGGHGNDRDSCFCSELNPGRSAGAAEHIRYRLVSPHSPTTVTPLSDGSERKSARSLSSPSSTRNSVQTAISPGTIAVTSDKVVRGGPVQSITGCRRAIRILLLRTDRSFSYAASTAAWTYSGRCSGGAIPSMN